jgi:hypothetical protein
VSEAGVPGYAAEARYGLYAPAKTPPEIIDRLNTAAKAVQSEAFKKLGYKRRPGHGGRAARCARPLFCRRGNALAVIEDAGIKAE